MKTAYFSMSLEKNRAHLFLAGLPEETGMHFTQHFGHRMVLCRRFIGEKCNACEEAEWNENNYHERSMEAANHRWAAANHRWAYPVIELERADVEIKLYLAGRFVHNRIRDLQMPDSHGQQTEVRTIRIARYGTGLQTIFDVDATKINKMLITELAILVAIKGLPKLDYTTSDDMALAFPRHESIIDAYQVWGAEPCH